MLFLSLLLVNETKRMICSFNTLISNSSNFCCKRISLCWEPMADAVLCLWHCVIYIKNIHKFVMIKNTGCVQKYIGCFSFYANARAENKLNILCGNARRRNVKARRQKKLCMIY